MRAIRASDPMSAFHELSARAHPQNVVRWVLTAAFGAAFVAWAVTDVLRASREVFVLAYAIVGGLVFLRFTRDARFEIGVESRQHLFRTALVTVLTSLLVVRSVLLQPGAARAVGARLGFEIAWDGVLYGAVDGALLTVVPMAAVLRNGRGARAMILAVVASVFVFVVYHLGFVEFRNASLIWPVVAGVIYALSYATTRNPLAPIVAHATMHVAAVLHGAEGTLQLPPHY